mgnify:CR=1 FL=1
MEINGQFLYWSFLCMVSYEKFLQILAGIKELNTEYYKLSVNFKKEVMFTCH